VLAPGQGEAGLAVRRAVRAALAGGPRMGQALLTQMVHAHPTPGAAGEKSGAACAPAPACSGGARCPCM
jgi:hypothetical protein